MLSIEVEDGFDERGFGVDVVEGEEVVKEFDDIFARGGLFLEVKDDFGKDEVANVKILARVGEELLDFFGLFWNVA